MKGRLMPHSSPQPLLLGPSALVQDTTYTAMCGSPGPSQPLRGAMFSLELGIRTRLEHSLNLLKPLADLVHLPLLGVCLDATSLHCSLDWMPVSGVCTLPLTAELQLPILWVFPMSWELQEATDSMFLSLVLSMGLGTEWTPAQCLWQNKEKGEGKGRRKRKRKEETERKGERKRKWEGKRDTGRRKSKGREPRESREGREKLSKWGKKKERERELSCPGGGAGLPCRPCLSLWPSVSSSLLPPQHTPLIKVCVSNRTGWSKTTSPMKCLAFLPGSCFSPLPELCSGIYINNVKAHIWGVGSKQLRPLGVEGHFTQV